MNTSDVIALGTLVVAAVGLTGAAGRFVYQAMRERRGITVSVTYHGEGPFFVTELRFPTATKTACVSRVGFAVSLVINNNRNTPLVVSQLGIEHSAGRVEPPIGGVFRHVTVTHDDIEFADPILLPHQIGAHDALAVSGVFQVLVPHDTGAPLLRLYCPSISEEKMKQCVSELQSHLLRNVDVSPLGIELVDVQFPEMTIKDPLLQREGARITVTPRFGRIPLNASIEVLGYCQQHGLALPATRLSTSTSLAVIFGNRKPLGHKFKKSDYPLWFLTGNAG